MQIVILYGRGPKANYYNVNDKFGFMHIYGYWLYYMKMWFRLNFIVTRNALIIILMFKT